MKKILLSGALLISTSASFAQTSEDVIGCWTMPTRAGENMQLNRDGSFSFNDYNAKLGWFENLSGTWMLNGQTLTLLYIDRPKQRFQLSKMKSGWSITKGKNYRLIKAQPGECVSPG